jgi:PKD repeat protein
MPIASVTAHITDDDTPPAMLYFSLGSDGSVGGLSVSNEDIVAFHGSSFSLYMDGSDVGLSGPLGGFTLDAFAILPDGSILMSFAEAGIIPAPYGGAADLSVDDSDVVMFTPAGLGADTAGTFEMYFDGSDVGLTRSGEDVDAIEWLDESGHLLISTNGTVSVPGVYAADEDILRFAPTSLGPNTSGSWSFYFDGSDVGLGDSSSEDTNALALDADGAVYLSTVGSFGVSGISGGDEDVFVFRPTSLGAGTSGAYDSTLFFDGSVYGLAGNNLFAIDLPTGPPDTTPPSITDVDAPPLSITHSGAAITWTTDEASSSVVRYGTSTDLGIVASDNAMVTSHSVTLSDLLSNTTYYYEVSSTDAAGNTATDNNSGSYHTFTTTELDTEAPEIQSATGNTSATTGESVTVSATITDNVGVVSAKVHYTPIGGAGDYLELTYDDDDMWIASVPVASNSVGTITYHIEAKDAAENSARVPDSGTYSIQVTDNDAPVAVASGPAQAHVGNAVTFDGSGSTDNIGITSYTWNFGDGNSATGEDPSHTYNEAGAFEVTLTVKDSAGNESTNTLDITVTEEPIDVVVFEDSFEAGEWNGQWVEDGQNDWYRSTRRETDGFYSAEVDGSANNATLTMANSLDLSGASGATLTFDWFIEGNWDRGESIVLDVFSSGGWYDEIRALEGNTPAEGVWHSETVDLSAYLGSDFKIRFRATVSQSREDGNVDNVRIVSTGPGAASATALAFDTPDPRGGLSVLIPRPVVPWFPGSVFSTYAASFHARPTPGTNVHALATDAAIHALLAPSTESDGEGEAIAASSDRREALTLSPDPDWLDVLVVRLLGRR